MPSVKGETWLILWKQNKTWISRILYFSFPKYSGRTDKAFRSP